jgi:uncharacterized protein YjbJ (UPF0337 family)
LGLVSLLRTNPQIPSAGAEMVTRATEVAGSVRDKVERWRASDRAAQAGEFAASAKEKLGELASDTRDAARAAAAQAASTAQSLTERGAKVVYDTEERDKYLLGTAAVALAAAIGITLQRRMS